MCQVVGLNQNYTSSAGTPYHIQIEDRGPLVDRVTETPVRRVNVIVYANYGEPNARIVHGSMIMGVVLFALITHFVIRPQRTVPPLATNVLTTLLTVAIFLTLGGFGLRFRLPRRSRDASADLFWSTATVPLLIAVMPFEAAGLLAIVAYLLGAPLTALGVAGVAVIGMLSLYPGFFDRT